MSTWPPADTDADLVSTDVVADACSPARARHSLLIPFASRFNNLRALVNSIIAYGDPKVIPPGRLIKVTKYAGAAAGGTLTATFNAQPQTAFVIVEVQAGGGAGVRVQSVVAAGAGGQSGAYCLGLIQSGFSSASVFVGGGSNGIGNGLGSSFGGLISCAGGGSSVKSSSGSYPVLSLGSVAPSGGVTVDASVQVIRSIERRNGGYGVVFSASTAITGCGADSPMGAGAPSVSVTSSLAGNGGDAPANGYGAGASGSYLLPGGGTPALSGGVASGGCVIVYEYS